MDTTIIGPITKILIKKVVHERKIIGVAISLDDGQKKPRPYGIA
jgi:hypothetical protein